MKRSICICLTILFLMFVFTLSCGAKESVVRRWRYTYVSYRQYVRSAHITGTLPEDFVDFRQISALGNFQYFESPLSLRYSSYDYGFEDAVSEFCLNISYYRVPAPLPPGFIASTDDEIALSIDEIENLSHMTTIKARPYEGVDFVVCIGNAKYYYFHNIVNREAPPTLRRIEWTHNNHRYQLLYINDYPAGQDTLVGRLLNLETAEAAVDELMADVDGDYEMPAEDWHLIVPRILGVITFITLLTVGIRRSKKKKAALAGGGEDGMDDAGEDVDSANKSDSNGEETDSGGVKISDVEDTDISRDDTAPNPPTDPG